ncbi:ATP-binding cassette, subfamily B (MDR/TAP), member 1 [Coniosporium apollinis CBS 100218]|uniref:ATP-binding cassette, subfamily B (MDR/TAP), member 1 n=1 Tax=Coniosporium apollinis (strain CBS 100218) TaxID=1168221 RepID=R7YVV1_CONA1|nr:ATP-binding cassette, subfamily B (MDR/TAP), member 1 [Coniosporium apollinis CBS 100218]EON66022.1 ATP-binding cassette, subfamily B (MDR/TAP), member 1 [Coniosporium apollinis CBS 100218]
MRGVNEKASNSSGSEGASIDEITQDREKALTGQAPVPVDPGVLEKLDSRVVKVEEGDDDPLGHLPEHERQILKRQLDVPPVKVTYITLYRYATTWDKVIIAISAICAFAGGAILPLMTIIFGQLAGTFQGLFLGTLAEGQFASDLAKFTLYFVYLGIGEFVTIYITTVGFLYTGEHISSKMREEYLQAILRQNIGFFDKLGAGEITTRITSDSNLVQDGISEKVGLVLTSLASFITAFVIGFVVYWKLTLILTSTIFAITFTMGGGSNFMMKYNKKSLESYALGGTVAEEVLSSIRNATAFNTQDKLARQYDVHLKEAEKWGLKMKIILAVMIGGMMGIIYLNYGLAFWMGSRYLVAGETELSDIITILLAVIFGAFSLGHIGPWISAFTTGTAAAAKIYSTIDRVSPLDPMTSAGKTLDVVEGTVELRNVKHIYPSRPEVVVMEDVNLVVPAGKTTALVGASGSGKSTIVGLVERFYDPVGGTVLLDGHNIQDLNLHWLRRQISLVQQEPVLFAVSIFSNIRHGLIGTSYEHLGEEKIKEMVINAAKMSNAHDFITALPEGYETNVGERGFLMSGGQKQRIAIARAIVSDPKILLLDEATSALDTKSEGVVQAALDKAAQGRTTIVIAHRLSTIKGADNIVVMTKGRIVEQGTHDGLLERKGAYYNLVEAQRISAANQGKDEDEVAILDERDDQLCSPATEKGNAFDSDPDDVDPANRLNRTQTGKSASSIELQKRKAETKGEYSLWTLIKLVGSFNKKEWHFMLIGLFWSIIAGGGNPVQAIFFAKCIVALSRPPNEYAQLRSEANFWSAMYLMLGITQFISFWGQGIAFAFCSERLVHRIRDRAFRTMLRQDIAFFDKEENNAGALTSFLSTETTKIEGLSGVTLGTLLIVTTTLVAAIAISLAIGWKLALVCIATIPVLLACGFFRFWMLARFETRSKKAYANSASYACEATSAIRTVASLTREDDVYQQYHAKLVAQRQKSLRSILRSSILYAASQSLMFLCMALGFWYGGTLLASGEYTMLQFFICFTAVTFSAQSAGTIFSFAPDMGKAKHAAAGLKDLFDRKPEIDSWSEVGQRLSGMEGSIEFRDVHFRYPTRPEQPVLRGLNLTVKPGQYVALVGASGCGKSTTIALLERFYDPLVGGVYVDGREISSLNITDYRSYLALVSQEPTLYQGTIRENILLGADNDDVSEELIVQACKDANIYEFILSLPDGFNTICGSKGTLLSGGQKQRIAIARALLRDPKILLLDEATSALDSESEKVVQAALDAAAKGRTTIAVAHRLSTIQKADIIYVFDGGRVVERGTHSELITKGGRYFELVSLQSLGKAH